MRAHAPSLRSYPKPPLRSNRRLTQSTRAVQCKALKHYVIEFDKRPDTAPVRATISHTPTEYQEERSLETYRINRVFCQTMTPILPIDLERCRFRRIVVAPLGTHFVTSE